MINISLDTLDPRKYAAITRRDVWDQAWAGIKAALDVGMDPVKLNVVLVRGTNDDEILQFGELAANHPLHVRFIELMPLGEGCHIRGGLVPSDEVLDKLSAAGELTLLSGGHPAGIPAGVGPATVYRWRGGLGTIGIIPAMSHKFCASCNRLRLTADGKLNPCLASTMEVDMREPMRAGASDEQLAELYAAAIRLKPQCHHMGDAAEADAAETRRMYRIGG